MSYQKVILIGNLGADPEMRYTPAGKAVTSFSLAISKKWTTPDGEKREKTLWVRVAAWEKLAELANQYLAKGRQCMVEGELEPANAYTNKAGEPAASIEITAREIRFLGSAGETSNSEAATAANVAAKVAQRVAATREEDIPF